MIAQYVMPTVTCWYSPKYWVFLSTIGPLMVLFEAWVFRCWFPPLTTIIPQWPFGTETCVPIVYSTVCSCTEILSMALAFVKGIHCWMSLTKGQLCENVSIWWRHHICGTTTFISKDTFYLAHPLISHHTLLNLCNEHFSAELQYMIYAWINNYILPHSVNVTTYPFPVHLALVPQCPYQDTDKITDNIDWSIQEPEPLLLTWCNFNPSTDK